MPRTVGELSPHEVDVHVGRQVADLRKSRGFNQTHLAKALGLTFQQIQKYEKGTNRFSDSKLWRSIAGSSQGRAPCRSADRARGGPGRSAPSRRTGHSNGSGLDPANTRPADRRAGRGDRFSRPARSGRT
ncbi:helix-turn-helix domain-containing protein [Brevundimonas sp.]|uniref:helix-turn-helix domain-containing protein n=1 Tax=Brevundimonas sp. TaxID=1871086 RepID=UPI0038D42C8E